MISIYQYKTVDTVRATVEPDDSSALQKEIMGTTSISLSFSSAVFIDFKRGDFINCFAEVFKLNTLPVVNKVAGRKYQFSLNFEGLMYDLGKCQYLFLDSTNQFTEGKFSLNGKPEDFLNLLVKNLERLYPDEGWNVGYVVEADYKVLEFSSNNCLEVLGRLADEFKTEYIVEGTRISLYKKQTASGVTLKYGKGNGLLSITRNNQDNSNKITRLYVYGGNKNLGSDYRNGAQQLRMAQGLYLEKGTSQFELVEDTVVFEDVFPHRTGIISAVTSPFIFTDNSMDFDIHTYLLPGVSAKITFNTGLLAGYEFEVSAYNYSTKTFTIIKNMDEQTVDVPSIDLHPAIGDQYVLTDITLPQSYIDSAELLLKNKGAIELNKRHTDNPAYSIVCDPIYFKNYRPVISLGQTIGLDIDSMGINQQIRIIGYTRNLRTPSLYTMKLADTVKVNALVKLINGI